MASIDRRPNGRWRARYYDTAGKQHARHFGRKVDAQRWLNEVTASVVTGHYVSPATASMTLGEWSDRWLSGYAQHRPSTVRQARVHLRLIRAEFGAMALRDVRPSHVKSWVARLRAEGRADSYVYATYRRLAQLMGDAVADGIIPRSPCSRRIAPAGGAQRPYVATTEQVWGVHEAFPEGLRPAVLLGAFAGLRTAEVVALTTADVDLMRGVITPARQHGGAPLKSKASGASIPIPHDLTLTLSAELARTGSDHFVTSPIMRPTTPWAIERAMRAARAEVADLPEGFRFHDLRHYFASLLIAAGLDVKVVQARVRHASATTTLNTYGHLWPDSDESSRAAVASAWAREDSSRTQEVVD